MVLLLRPCEQRPRRSSSWPRPDRGQASHSLEAASRPRRRDRGYIPASNDTKVESRSEAFGIRYADDIILGAAVSIYDEQVPVVKSFEYLGGISSGWSTCSDEFQTRLNQGFAELTVLKPVLQHKDIPARLKVELSQVLVFPVVTYGCKAWSLSKDERNRLTRLKRRYTDVLSGFAKANA